MNRGKRSAIPRGRASGGDAFHGRRRGGGQLMVEPPAGVAFCGDDALAYRRSRTRFAPGEGLTLDEAYRRAHLPLVAPRHPSVIAADVARGYAMGRHAPVFSLVLPVPAAALEAAGAWRPIA